MELRKSERWPWTVTPSTVPGWAPWACGAPGRAGVGAGVWAKAAPARAEQAAVARSAVRSMTKAFASERDRGGFARRRVWVREARSRMEASRLWVRGRVIGHYLQVRKPALS